MTSIRKISHDEAHKIANHIRDCQLEVDSINEHIQSLISSLSSADLANTLDDDYRAQLAKIRRYQSARAIMLEQIREMESVLRA